MKTILIYKAVRSARRTLNDLVVPTIKAYACKRCSTIASVSLMNNKITIKKCRCV